MRLHWLKTHHVWCAVVVVRYLTINCIYIEIKWIIRKKKKPFFLVSCRVTANWDWVGQVPSSSDLIIAIASRYINSIKISNPIVSRFQDAITLREKSRRTTPNQPLWTPVNFLTRQRDSNPRERKIVLQIATIKCLWKCYKIRCGF